MILSDVKIRELLKSGELLVTPLEDDGTSETSQVQPASIDLKLGRHFRKINENTVTYMTLDDEPEYEEIEADEILIPPLSFVLATTKEYIGLPNYLSAFVEGRSSIGRMGLFIQNAGWVDPGFEGEITLELFNANRVPIKLKADRRICQLVLAQMDQEAKNPYNGKYQGQRGATGSRVFKDYENTKE